MNSNLDTNKAKVINKIALLWHPLSERQIELLASSITIRNYAKNEIIFNDYERPKEIRFLAHGKVKVSKDGVNGRNQIIRVMKSGEFFGYRAYFAEELYKSSATAIEQCEVAAIPISTFQQVMTDSLHIAHFFLKILAGELGIADDRTVNLTQKHIRARLAESLLSLKHMYGLEEDGCTLSIYLSREEIANMSNMTTSNAIRTLSGFATEKLVAVDGRKIKILQEEQLNRISSRG